MKRLSTCMLVVACVFATMGVASAQEITTGSIAGRVIDQQDLPVPGAAVNASSPQGSKTTTTDNDGRFFIPFLTPGMYTVSVELQGFKRVERKNVEVRLGQRTEIPVTMQAGGVTEVIEVTASSPVVDTSSAAVGSSLDNAVLQRIPVGRRFSDTLYVAPGVSSGGGTGTANPSVAGGSGLENQYIVDGVNITNSGYGALGSYSIVFGSLGNGVTFDFIKEVQVKTAGYEAEYGQSTGGVVNVITKSGSNELDGSLFGYFQPEGLEGDWKEITLVNGFVNTTSSSRSDVGALVSGPIMRDRAFFFAAVNPQWETRTFIAPADFPLRSLGKVDRERRIFTYSGKGTFQLSSNHRFDASFFGDPAHGANGPQRAAALLRQNRTAFSEIDTYGGHNQAVRYDGIVTPHWLLEASFARAKNEIREIPEVNEWQVIDRTVSPLRQSGGIGFYEVGNLGKNLQYNAKSTHIIGPHQVRYGLLYEDIKYDNVINRTGPTFTLPDGTKTVTGGTVNIQTDPVFGRIYRVSRANTSNVRNTEQQYVSFFVQDTWRVGPKLTIRPGVRYEQQKLVGNLADFKWDGNWGPRIGVTYDPMGQGKAKIYGNFGRFYAKIPNDLAARSLSADAGVTRADYFDAALTRPIPNGTLAGGQTVHQISAGRVPADFDKTSKSTYLDEYLVGAEYEAFPGLSVGVRYIFRDMPRVLEDIGTATFVQYDLGVPGLESVEYFITNPRNNYPAVLNNAASFEDPIHKYHAVELTADRRFSNNWAVQASYRWSRLKGNFEGFFRNDNGQSDPAITSLFDFPTNDPTYTSIGVPRFGYRGDVRFLGKLGEGPLPNDRTHQVKLYGAYTFNMGLNIGAGIVLSSGRPLTPMAANPNYFNAGEIPEGPRGSGIRTVDGVKKRTPFENEVNLHLDYAVKMGGQRAVLLADLFNLFQTQRVRDYDQNTEAAFQDPNPDFGRLSGYQVPRQIRLGVRFEF